MLIFFGESEPKQRHSIAHMAHLLKLSEESIRQSIDRLVELGHVKLLAGDSYEAFYPRISRRYLEANGLVKKLPEDIARLFPEVNQ